MTTGPGWSGIDFYCGLRGLVGAPRSGQEGGWIAELRWLADAERQPWRSLYGPPQIPACGRPHNPLATFRNRILSKRKRGRVGAALSQKRPALNEQNGATDQGPYQTPIFQTLPQSLPLNSRASPGGRVTSRLVPFASHHPKDRCPLKLTPPRDAYV